MNDYYELAINHGDSGCCLVCDDAEPGCLCFGCKCTKCSRYDTDLKKCEIAVLIKNRASKISIEYKDIKYETEKAYLINFFDKECWLPKSKIEITTFPLQDKKSDLNFWMGIPRVVNAIRLPKWLAVAKGLWELDDFDYGFSDSE